MNERLENEDLWKDLHEGIRAFVRRRVRNQADADDVVQGIFLRVHRGLGSLRDSERVHAWIYGAARNAIIDHYRARGRAREEAAGSWDDLSSGRPDSGESDESALRELAGCLRPLMRRLPATDREALELIEIEGRSQAASSRQLKLSLSGMKSRVQRARRKLRSLVEACCRVDVGARGSIRAYEERAQGACGGSGPCGCVARPALEPPAPIGASMTRDTFGSIPSVAGATQGPKLTLEAC